MKLSKRSLTMAVLMIACASVRAADSASITLTGSITPGSCTPVLDNATFGYGDVVAKIGQANLLSEKTADLTITCTAATKVGFKIIDGQPNSAPWATLTSAAGTDLPTFGLGFAGDGTTRIGAYTIAMDNMLVKTSTTSTAVNGQILFSVDGKTNWTPSPTAVAALGMGVTYAIAAVTDNTVTPYTVYISRLRLQAAIASKEALGNALSTDVVLHGMATINFDYL